MQDLAQVDFFVEEVGVGVISYILGKSFLMNTRKGATFCIMVHHLLKSRNR